MSQAEIRGVVHGRTIVLDEAAETLPEGTPVVIKPVEPGRGDPLSVLEALAKHPPMSDEATRKMRWDIAEADAEGGLAAIAYFLKFAAEDRG